MINTAISPRYKIRLTPHNTKRAAALQDANTTFLSVHLHLNHLASLHDPWITPTMKTHSSFSCQDHVQQITLTWCSCWCCRGTFETTIFHAIQQASPCSCNTSLTPQTVSDLNKASHSTLPSSLMTSSQHLRKVSSSSPI